MRTASCELGPLRLAYPVVNASGTCDLLELAEACDPGVLRDPPLGAYVPKTVTLEPREGNAPPRIVETAGGMVNSVGLPNEGIDHFAADKLPRLLGLGIPVIVNVAGFSLEEYARLAERLARELSMLAGHASSWTGRVALELNVSCPNVHDGGMVFGCDAGLLAEVVRLARAEWPGFLIVKLTPNVTEPAIMGLAAVEAGADCLSLVNTFKGMVLDRHSLRPLLGGVTGGLSGPAIKPLALRCVYEVYAELNERRRLGVPLIGMGGVTGVEDVLDFLACGASVVAVGSGLFRDPWLVRTMGLGLRDALAERGLDLAGIVGLAHRPRG